MATRSNSDLITSRNRLIACGCDNWNSVDSFIWVLKAEWISLRLKNSISDFQLKMPFTKLLIWIMILFINFHNIVTDKTTTKDPKKEFCKINKFDQVVDVLLPGSRVTYFIVNRIYWPVLTIVNGYDYKLSLTSAEAIQGASKWMINFSCQLNHF